MSAYRCTVPGWKLDADLWWVRPVRPGDKTNIHTFIENGRIYTRNNELARLIDAGQRIPANFALREVDYTS